MMQPQNRLEKQLYWTVTVAMLLALLVVMLGAYTRLTHAGLGCPDWPGCYGHMVAPVSNTGLDMSYASTPLHVREAWTEMVHRYAAGTLVLLVLLMNRQMWRLRQWHAKLPTVAPWLILALIVFQALLGMWTVTLKLLPLVVIGHLLGGFFIFSGLSYVRLKLIMPPSSVTLPRMILWLGLFLVVVQVILGGFVSANYAGISCIGFPRCNGHWIPTLDLAEAFRLWRPIGENYQGGVLDMTARVTLQWIHRLGALGVFLYSMGIGLWLLFRQSSPQLNRLAGFLMGLVTLQCILGIFNVVYGLPLTVAVLHNGVAAMLVATWVMLISVARQD
jgi:cytochrome c oxidase assembly protein subunit 15